MSYEGYTEYLCANGHRRVFNCWGHYDEACNCGAPLVFSHMVDQTNDEGNPYPFEIATAEEGTNCNMGHYHVTKEVTYKIPVK